MTKSEENCIVIFSNTFWSIYNFRRSLIKGLQAEGYKIVAVSANDRYRSAVEALGCQTVVLENMDAKSTSVLKEIKLILEIRRVLKQVACSYVYSFTIKPNVYTALTQFFRPTKTVVTINGLGNVFSGGKLLRFISLQLFRITFAKAHRIVFQNRDDYHFFRSRIRTDEKKVLFVRGSGINVSEFTPSPRLPHAGKNLVFLLACRLLKEKGVYEYIEAARRVKTDYPEAQFWLIGMPAINKSAIDVSTLRPYEEQGIIQLIPPTDDINTFLQNIDALVLPSYYNEGVPRILLEGLSKGLPIITTNSVGCKETVVDGVNGFLIEPRSIDALDKALRNMLESTVAERQSMRKESRRLAETEFEEKEVIAAYVRIVRPNARQMALSGV